MAANVQIATGPGRNKRAQANPLGAGYCAGCRGPKSRTPGHTPPCMSDLDDQAESARAVQEVLDEQTERERVKKVSEEKAESDRAAQSLGAAFSIEGRLLGLNNTEPSDIELLETSHALVRTPCGRYAQNIFLTNVRIDGFAVVMCVQASTERVRIRPTPIFLFERCQNNLEEQDPAFTVTEAAAGAFQISEQVLNAALMDARYYCENKAERNSIPKVTLAAGAAPALSSVATRGREAVEACSYPGCALLSQAMEKCRGSGCVKSYHRACQQDAHCVTTTDGVLLCESCGAAKAGAKRTRAATTAANSAAKRARERQQQQQLQVQRRERDLEQEQERERERERERDWQRSVSSLPSAPDPAMSRLEKATESALALASASAEALKNMALVQKADTSTANISNTVWLDVMDKFRGLVNEGNRHNESIHKQTVDGNVIISGHRVEAQNATPETTRAKKRRLDDLQSAVIAEHKAKKSRKMRKLRRVAEEAERVAKEAAAKAAQAAAAAVRAVSGVSDTDASDQSDSSEED